MNILLDDISFTNTLYPFGEVRSAAHIRIGILTIFEKWNFYFPGKVFIVSERLNRDLVESDCIKYPANFVPSYEFLKQISVQKVKIPYTQDCKILEYPWQIFEYNDWAIRQDFEMVTAGRNSEKIPASNYVVNPQNIFLEPGY
jgi:hypothetical protein